MFGIGIELLKADTLACFIVRFFIAAKSNNNSISADKDSITCRPKCIVAFVFRKNR